MQNCLPVSAVGLNVYLPENTKTVPIHSDQDGFTVDFMKESGVLNEKNCFKRSEIHIQRR